MSVKANWSVEMELNGFGSGWTDVTSDVRVDESVQVKYGITGVGVTDRVASTGTMQLTLNNGPTNSGSPYADSVVRDGASGYWRLNETGYARQVMASGSPELTSFGYWRLGETTGTVAVDASGNGHNGTYTNNPTLGVAGPIFDGTTAVTFATASSQYVTMGDAFAFEFTGAFSVEAWVKWTTDTTYGIVTKALSGSNKGWALFTNNTTGRLTFLAFTSAGAQVFQVSTSGTAYNDGNWHYVVATWDGTTTANKVIIYVDGASRATGTAAAGTIDQNAAVFTIGGVNGANSNIDGSIDEVAVYNRELSATEVAAHYSAREYTDFIASARATDRTSNGRHGTYANGPSLGATSTLADRDTAVTFESAKSQYVTMGDVAAFEFAGAFSVECWVKFTSSANMMLVNKRNANGAGWFLGTDSAATGKFRFGAYTATPTAVWTELLTPLAYNDGQWHYVVATWDGTTSANKVQLYVDGVVKAQGTAGAGLTPESPNAYDFRVASRSDAALYFNGSIDDVAVYPLELTTAVVSTHYAQRLKSYGVTGYYSPDNKSKRQGFDYGIRARLAMSYYSRYAQEVLADGAVGYWRLGELSGTKANDLAIPAHHGLYVNTPTLGVTSPLSDSNTAVTFASASSEYMSVPATAKFDFTGARTIEFWFKRNGAPAAAEWVINKGGNSDAGPGPGYRIKIETTGAMTYDIRNSTDTGYAVTFTGPTNICNNTWHHIVAVWDGTTNTNGAKIYVDGAVYTQTTASTIAVSNDAGKSFQVARRHGQSTPGANYFDGSIDEIAVYDKALSSAQVSRHYALRTAIEQGAGKVYRFLGTLDSIKPTAGVRGRYLTRCTIVDWMDEAARYHITGVGLQTNVRADQVFSTVVAAMPVQPAAIAKTTGLDIYPYALDNVQDSQTTAMSIFNNLAMSDLGYIYIQSDTTQGGTLTYESRSVRSGSSSTVQIFSNTMDDVVPIVAREQLLNKVQVTTHPRKVDISPTTVLFTLNQSTLVGPGAQLAISGQFRDPESKRYAGGTAMVVPIAVTDYTMNTNADGTGGDLTSAFTVSTTFSSNSATFIITNTGATPGYITFLQCRGKGVYDYNTAVSKAEDTTSQAAYGQRTINTDMPYQADPSIGDEAAQYILQVYKQRKSYVTKLTILGNWSDANMRACLLRNISDAIGLDETITGLVSTTRYFINGIDIELTQGPTIHTSFVLAPADNTSYWYLEVVGKSELGSTTRLGFGLIVGHTDVAHGDSHGDSAHSDTAHTDSSHSDSHTDAGHQDQGHVDTHGDTHSDGAAHSDSHSDVAHSDSHTDDAHGDSHSDVSHSDTVHDDSHSDTHTDFFDVDFPFEDHTDVHSDAHDDAHGDTAFSDSHSDSSHGDSHGDTAHTDSHSDVAHSDSHTDDHSDAAHGDVGHQDTHSDVAHGDVSHVDIAHSDSHNDTSHGDAG